QVRRRCVIFDLLDQTKRQQFLERADTLILATPAGLTQDLEIERTSDYRGSMEQLMTSFAHGRQTRAKQTEAAGGQLPYLRIKRQRAIGHKFQVASDEQW